MTETHTHGHSHTHSHAGEANGEDRAELMLSYALEHDANHQSELEEIYGDILNTGNEELAVLMRSAIDDRASSHEKMARVLRGLQAGD